MGWVNLKNKKRSGTSLKNENPEEKSFQLYILLTD